TGGGAKLEHFVRGNHGDVDEYINDVSGSAELGTIGNHEEVISVETGGAPA
ncbi:hypothetical protein E2562_038641, partial [Oryza meyeriana var. granulata]